MKPLSGTAELECEHCDNQIYVDAFDLGIDQVGVDERQMGLEILYEGLVNLNCPKCGGYIQVRHEASDYPVDTPNYSDTYAEGARIIRGFQDIDVSHQDRIYSFEEESRLYLPEEKKIFIDLSSCLSELILKIAETPNLLHQISWRKFEELIAHVFQKHEFKVDLTRKSKDGGRDIIAIKSELGLKSKYLIECKHYAANNPVGVGLVRALFGAQQFEGANKSVLVTTSRFTSGAREFANKTHITKFAMDLKDFNDIYQWIKSTATKH